MNKRIRKKKVKALVLKERVKNVIFVEKEDMKFLQDMLKALPRYLPWVHKVPRRLFLDF